MKSKEKEVFVSNTTVNFQIILLNLYVFHFLRIVEERETPLPKPTLFHIIVGELTVVSWALCCYKCLVGRSV